MDAWETLIAGSTIADAGGDAWEHLQAQDGGVVHVELTDGLSLVIESHVHDVILADNEISIGINSTDFALGSEDYGIAIVNSTDFALGSEDYGIAIVNRTDFALTVEDLEINIKNIYNQ